ncbi:MAG: YebC/PmpR family DNA-binding transcriptional regulator, partial [Pseudomonadota bacterium]|nr:YebC/PmpR family DNA-binding transcriptional regulator [Pseudomonadota bacterium]
EAGADDVVVRTVGSIEVLTSPEQFESVRDAMQKAGLQPADAAVTLRADTAVAVTGETAEQVCKLLDWLEELDDVQDVHCNAELPAEPQH